MVRKSGKTRGTGLQITDDPNAPAVRLVEEELLKKIYPFDYRDLVRELSSKYIDFKLNPKFHYVIC